MAKIFVEIGEERCFTHLIYFRGVFFAKTKRYKYGNT